MHNLIVGTTGSGKSRLSGVMCAELTRRGRITAVLDPMYDDRWQCTYKTPDLDVFFRFTWSHKDMFLFIDEAGGMGKYNKPLEKLMTKGRHLGHSVTIITQYPQQLSPVVRGMCSKAYIFATSRVAVELMAEDFNKPELVTVAPPAVTPGKGSEFLMVPRFEKIERKAIDFASGGVYKSLTNKPHTRNANPLEVSSCSVSLTKTATNSTPSAVLKTPANLRTR